MNTSKQIRIMVILIFAALIAAGAYTVWDPSRANNAKAVQLTKTTNRGAYLFAQNCRTCHGNSGQGGVKGNRLALAPPLNRPDLQGRKTANGPVDKANKDSAYRFVFNTITCGRIGKAMPTWGDSQGGPLNPEQIKDLSVFITQGNAWGTAAEYARELSDSSRIRLTKPLDASGKTVSVSLVDPLGKDTYLQIDDELLKVNTVDKGAGTVTVDRGQGNTTAAAHKAGASVLIEPPIIDPAKASITGPACGQTAPVVQPTPSGPAGTPTAAPTPAANAQTITIVGENVTFDKTAITANAGAPITITFENKDASVDHNIHFFEGSSASGKSVAATDVAAGPKTQTLNLGTLKPGTYYYQCDVHPDSMNGILTVK
ncbi:MAG: cupredoxin domain-containing protein [Dehalococcoidia bacterium]|nr:cupredoxin domain-containing protein [Dehalococcoidia bacterium]